MTPSAQDLRDQLRQLKSLHQSGALDDAQYASSRGRLEQALQQLGPEAQALAARPGIGLWAGAAVFVVGVAVAGYAFLGRPASLGASDGAQAGAAAPAQAASGAQAAPTPEQVNEMVARLAERLKGTPDDAEGWIMLGRAYTVMSRHAEAQEAFARVVKLRPDDAGALADYADALAVNSEKRLEGEPTRLIERALQLDPGNLKALALSGAAAYDRNDFAGAARQWDRVASLGPADSPMARQAREWAEDARRRQAETASAPAAAASAATPPTAAAAPASPAALTAAAVSGVVSLSPKLKAQVSPEDTVFIFARAAQGGRMPLAIVRKQVKDLPFTFKLDDSLAMAPGAGLSSAISVVVGARVSKSGQAMPQAGDLEGLSAAVSPKTSGLRIEISSVLP